MKILIAYTQTRVDKQMSITDRVLRKVIEGVGVEVSIDSTYLDERVKDTQGYDMIFISLGVFGSIYNAPILYKQLGLLKDGDVELKDISSRPIIVLGGSSGIPTNVLHSYTDFKVFGSAMQGISDLLWGFKRRVDTKGVFIESFYTDSVFNTRLCNKVKVEGHINYSDYSEINSEGGRDLFVINWGCGRACHFCMEGNCANTYQEKSLLEVIREIKDKYSNSGNDTVSPFGLSISAHSEFENVIEVLRRYYGKVTFLNERVIDYANGKQKLNHQSVRVGMAIEGVSERLRTELGKSIPNEVVLRAFDNITKSTVSSIKLGMILTGWETVEDWAEFKDLLREVCGVIKRNGSNVVLQFTFTSLHIYPYTKLYSRDRAIAKDSYNRSSRYINQFSKVIALCDSLGIVAKVKHNGQGYACYFNQFVSDSPIYSVDDERSRWFFSLVNEHGFKYKGRYVDGDMDKFGEVCAAYGIDLESRFEFRDEYNYIECPSGVVRVCAEGRTRITEALGAELSRVLRLPILGEIGRGKEFTLVFNKVMDKLKVVSSLKALIGGEPWFIEHIRSSVPNCAKWGDANIMRGSVWAMSIRTVGSITEDKLSSVVKGIGAKVFEGALEQRGHYVEYEIRALKGCISDKVLSRAKSIGSTYIARYEAVISQYKRVYVERDDLVEWKEFSPEVVRMVLPIGFDIVNNWGMAVGRSRKRAENEYTYKAVRILRDVGGRKDRVVFADVQDMLGMEIDGYGM